jgi:hypothetical protein
MRNVGVVLSWGIYCHQSYLLSASARISKGQGYQGFLKGKNNACVHCISISATNTENIGHFGTPYSSNRLIENGSWPRPLKNDVGMWR